MLTVLDMRILMGNGFVDIFDYFKCNELHLSESFLVMLAKLTIKYHYRVRSAILFLFLWRFSYISLFLRISSLVSGLFGW